MTSRMTSKLYTEAEIGFERVFEIRVLDLRRRADAKQKSFSISVKQGVKDNEFISAIELKEKLEGFVKGNL